MSPLSRRTQRGFSMIEALVAIVVLSIALIGLIALQARAVQFSIDAEDQNRAALLANEIAAQMWLTNTTVLAPAVVSAWQDRVADTTAFGLPDGEGTVEVEDTVATITITWRPAGAASGANPNRYTTQVMF